MFEFKKIREIRKKYGFNRISSSLNVYYVSRLIYGGEKINFLLPFADKEPFLRIIRHFEIPSKLFEESFSQFFRKEIRLRNSMTVSLPCLTNYFWAGFKNNCVLCEKNITFQEYFATVGYLIDEENKMKKENLSILVFDSTRLDILLRMMETLKYEDLVPIKLVFERGNFEVKPFGKNYWSQIIEKYNKDKIELKEILISLTPSFFRNILRENIMNVNLLKDFYSLLSLQLTDKEKTQNIKQEAVIGVENNLKEELIEEKFEFEEDFEKKANEDRDEIISEDKDEIVFEF